jgi:hypothetical protein
MCGRTTLVREVLSTVQNRVLRDSDRVHVRMRRSISSVFVAVLILVVAAPVSAGDLPLKDPPGLARARQSQLKKTHDPRARCRVVSRFIVRCTWPSTNGIGPTVESLEKVGAHRLRTAVQYGDVIKVTFRVLKTRDKLYRYV